MLIICLIITNKDFMKTKQVLILLAISGVAINYLMSCKAMPKHAKPVDNFEIDKYLGLWYEIARIDFKHEEYLNQVTATYSKNPDGSIHVLNKGYHVLDKEWKTAEGKARFRGKDTSIAKLKVTFFGPFYSGYNVIDLTKDYNYALVAGKNLDYLWILSRKPFIPDNIKDRFLKKAQSIGYDTDRLLWIEHEEN